MVTKLGRKGNKSSVECFNAHPDDQDLIPDHMESIAWSYEMDGIAEENVPVHVHCRTENLQLDEEANTSGTTIDDNDSQSSISSNTASTTSNASTLTAYLKGHYKADRHLGVHRTLAAALDENAEKTLAKLHTWLNELRAWKIAGKPLPMTINALLALLVACAPLLQGLYLEQLHEIDERVQKQIQSACGLTDSDAKEPPHIQRNDMGMGIHNATVSHIVNVGQESEVLLNDNKIHAQVPRGRHKAATQPERPPALDVTGNALAKALMLLGKHGAFPHDQRHEVLNGWLDQLQGLDKRALTPIGGTGRRGKGATLDFQKSKLHKCGPGGEPHKDT